MSAVASAPVSAQNPAQAPVKALPMLDLTRQVASLQPALDEAVLGVLHSGGYILGPTVQGFEEEIARFISGGDNLQAIGVANGTDALYLALRALGIGHGDDVITTCHSYIATSEAIVRTGATPVFVDIDPNGSFNLDLSAIEAAITPKTKALLPVHLYGQALDMTRLMQIAKTHNLFVVEDCAQAIGATWVHNGTPQQVGSFGDLGCYSFFPTKNLGAAGDGGLVVTQNPELAEKVRMLRVHGAKTRYDHVSEGMNSRLDAIQAAILAVKLPHLTRWNAARYRLAQRYTAAFNNCQKLLTPVEQPNASHVYHQYTLRVLQGKRDELQQALAAQGIASMIYYPIPLHLQGMHQNLGYKAGSLPVAEAQATEVLSLPIFPEMTEAEQDRVITAVLDFFNN